MLIDTAESEPHFASNIGRKRLFGQISTCHDTDSALVDHSNMDPECKGTSQKFKKSSLATNYLKTIQNKELLDVKEKLNQIEIEMSKLRSKQVEFEKNDGKTYHLLNSGAQKDSEDTFGSRTVLVANAVSGVTLVLFRTISPDSSSSLSRRVCCGEEAAGEECISGWVEGDTELVGDAMEKIAKELMREREVFYRLTGLSQKIHEEEQYGDGDSTVAFLNEEVPNGLSGYDIFRQTAWLVVSQIYGFVRLWNLYNEIMGLS